jgi:shikimate kinase
MMNPETRARMKKYSISVWMRADLKVIAERVQRRDTRPLLRGRDPLEALSQLAETRYPIYGQADLTVDVGGGSHGQAVEAIHKELRRHAREEGKR